MNDDPSSPGRLETALSTPSTTSLTTRLFGWMRPTNGVDLRTDLEDALANEQAPHDDFSPEERAMLRNILRLRGTRTEDVMVPRADIIAVDHTTSLGDVLAKLRTSGHSRMPVFDGSLDQPIGMVHIKDVVSYLIDRAQENPATGRAKARARKAAEAAKAETAGDATSSVDSNAASRFNLRNIDLETKLSDVSIIRQLLFVPASMSATDLMAQMQANRVQMALVIDEYGGTDGLVSLEDLIETVVGDIEDEHDDDIAPSLEALGDGGYLADARVPIEDVQEIFGDRLVVDEDDAEEIDTLGGIVFTALGRIPVRGELIDAVEGLDIEVTDADPRRIKKLKVYPAGLRRRDPRQPRRAARSTSQTANEAAGPGSPANSDTVDRPAAE
ncbi:MAG: hemolysin family protein [Cohaesibacteraceae bacterium]